MFTSSVIRAALGLALASATAGAQASSSPDSTEHHASALARRGSASLTVIQSRPQGAFGRNVGRGYGLDGAYLFRLDRAGVWSLRVNAGIIDYGHESRRTALSETIGGRVQVDVKTTNYIAPMSIGPQLTWPTGALRPYVNAGVGGQAFFTESRLESTSDRTAFAASWVAGGGVYMPVHTGKTNVQLDVGVQYLGGARARYLAPGSITDLPDAQVAVAPLESATHLVIVRLGARIGL